MDKDAALLTVDERAALQNLSQQTDIDGKRAAALLAIDAGMTQAEAAEKNGLTKGQVQYILRKFRAERLLAFPEGLALLSPDALQDQADDFELLIEEEFPDPSRSQIGSLIYNLDMLAKELRSTLPDLGQSAYSPLRMLDLVRNSVSRYTPQAQRDILSQFQELSRDDLLDLDTWKGIAYMIAYSVQFQAGQTREMLNNRLPAPVAPDNVYHNVRGGVDRITPDIAKNMAGTFEGATREDLIDPETWKGLAYMLAYSAQFQAGETKNALNQRLPHPVKPDTIYGLIMANVNRFTPDVAKELLSMFEGATREDLLDIDTWKGVWYMLTYSLQFQAEQFRQRFTGADEEE